jgi:tetratricopeptide (TPR) repeat protein
MTTPDALPLGRIITFYSYKGGTGRTMALANVAWILASQGRRVLAIDWDLESPGLHRYLHPFMVDKQLRASPGVIDMIRAYATEAMRPTDSGGAQELDIDELAQIQRYASSLEYPFPKGGLLDLVPAGRQVPAYSAAVSTFDWANFYDRLGGGAFLQALRQDLRRNYDYVLIDSRTGLSDSAGVCTVLLPDIVVVCFTMSTQSIDGAAAVARSIRGQRDVPVQLYPVPMRVEDGELGKLERGRTYARQRFEPIIRALELADPEAYWGSVEIPHRVSYAYEEILAAFGDRARQGNSLLAAYERLAAELVGAPCELPPMDDKVRLRWLADFERRTATVAISLVISYAARDRMWAEWVASELNSVGQPSILHEVRDPIDPIERADRLLVLISQYYLRAREAHRVLRRGTEREVPGPGKFLISVRLDGIALPALVTASDVLDLMNLNAARARDALLTVLELPETVAGPDRGDRSGSGARFPATSPPVWKLPPRNPAFTGRDMILGRLRDRLLAHTTAVPVALTGMGGVGKTQTALEYAHRFAADYDIVWWISADQPALVRDELASLAGALRLSPGETSEQANAAREALRQGTPSARWLLIFDDADEPEPLRDYLPEGPGDVIVTSRNPLWRSMAGDSEEVGVFDRHESVELMSRRVDRLAPGDAEDVAERLGDLPLLIEQAAGFLATTAIAAREYVDLLDNRLIEVLDGAPPPDYPNSAAVTWSLAMDRLRAQRPAAARLLELCAFFAPEPIATWLLSTPRMIRELRPYERALRDPLLQASLIRDIGRYALARVDPTTNTVILHRLVQTVIRGAMTSEARLESQVQVQEILAAAAETTQGGPDDPGNWARYASIRPHLEPSGALQARDDGVRLLVIDMVRYLRHRGDLAGSQELAERTLTQWEQMFDPDDPLTQRMRVRLANTLRDRGRYQDSYAISVDAFDRLTRALGHGHLHTLEAMGGLGADLWWLGEFQRARQINEAAQTLWREAIGPDQPRTLNAANNVALAYRLFGDYERALELDTETRAMKIRVTGPTSLVVLYTEDSLGRDYRDLGNYRTSRTQLALALDVARESLGPDHPQTLRIGKSLAVSLRRMGDLKAAYDLVNDVAARSERSLGRDHPETAASVLEMAATLSARDDHAGAQQLARNALSQFGAIYGEHHPLTLAVANDLGVFLLSAREPDEARRILESSHDDLEDMEGQLGKDHPYAIISQLNVATARHAAKEFADARTLDEKAQSRLHKRYGDRHPLTLIAAANLAVSLRDTGAVHDALTQLGSVSDIMQEVLGDGHVYVETARAGRRILIDIEPPPT